MLANNTDLPVRATASSPAAMAGMVEQKMTELAIGLVSAGHGDRMDEAISHHLRAGGRRFRAKLALSVSRALGVSTQDSLCMAAACELLHNASLIHDDLQDGDSHRRGAETVWSRFGTDTAICAGDLLISAAYAALADLSRPGCLGALLRATHLRVAEAAQGQAADLAFKGSSLSDLQAYERVAAAKSGSLLCLPVELPLVYAGYGAFLPEAQRSAQQFAIGYQIADDLKDVVADRGTDDTETALNAVLVLRAAGFDSSARYLARARAIELLSEAARHAARLPRDSGRPLADAAAALSEQL